MKITISIDDDLVQVIAAGIRVLNRTGFDIPEERVIERARNIAMGIASLGYEVDSDEGYSS